MNNKSLKLIIIFLLSSILIGGIFYFYNEYRKQQVIKNALVELAQEFNSNDENIGNDINILEEASSIATEPLTTIEQTPQRFLSSKPANCQIELAGKSIYDGACNFESSGGGSFSITGFDINQSLIGHVQEVSVEVSESKIGSVFGSNNEGSIHEWGQAKRSKGCWIGSNFKVCAYADDKKSKGSSVAQMKKPILEKEPVKQISKEDELEHVRKVLDEEMHLQKLKLLFIAHVKQRFIIQKKTCKKLNSLTV